MNRLLWLIPLLGLAASPAQALDLTRLRTLDGTIANGEYGYSVVVVGDMDGDGFAEYAVGASADPTGGAGAGRVFIFRGGPQHASDPPAWVITGQPGDLLGASLAAVGDVDGDGFADLLIGAPAGTTADPSLPGRAVLVFGSNPLGARAPVSFSGPAPGARFGAAVAGLGDWSGDGRPDFAVGAPDANNSAGLVELFFGGSASPTLGFTLHGRTAGDNFGSAVAGAGRTHGGPRGDLLVGAPFNSDSQVWAGKVYLLLGGSPPDTIPDMMYAGAAAGDFFGSALAGVGDVDGDGYDDFAIGAPGANDGSSVDVGRAYLFRGGATPPATSTLSVVGTSPYTELGLSVAGVGDVNADGLADWAAGAPGSPDASSAGEVRLFLGRPVPVASPDTVLTGEAVGDMFGRSISNGGSVDGGAHALFLIGAYAHGTGGRAYLYGSANATVSVPRAGASPLSLAAPSPNPAAARTRVSFALAHDGRADLAIVDLAGRRVRDLLDAPLEAGPHDAVLDVAGLPTGLYFVRLTAADRTLARKLIVVR